jgi:hypothetical protein
MQESQVAEDDYVQGAKLRKEPLKAKHSLKEASADSNKYNRDPCSNKHLGMRDLNIPKSEST